MVRAWAAALLLAVTVLGVAMPASGQDPQAPAPAPVTVLAEATDDVQLTGPAPPQRDPSGAVDVVDLVSVVLTETLLEIDVAITVAAWGGPDASPGQADHAVHFRHGDQTYRVLANSVLGASSATVRVSLHSYIGDGRYALLGYLPHRVEADTLHVPVPRELLVDGNGATPYPGRALDGFRAEARWFGLGNVSFGAGTPAVAFPDAVDRLPDQGEGTVPMPIVLGLAQSGHAVLRSPEPFRASNGEASTFVFRVNGTNLGEQDDFFDFTAKGVPPGWDVQLPGITRIPAKASVELPIIVRTAFAHEHGSTTSLGIEMASQSDPLSVGRVNIGLRYPAIAQPAGHHSALHLHSQAPPDDPVSTAVAAALFVGVGASSVTSYFNTAEDDERDDTVPHPGQYCRIAVQEDNDTVGGGYCWDLTLDPGLQMGLDFDMLRQGTYRIPVGSLYPQPGARLQGQLMYFGPEPSDVPPGFPPGFFSDGFEVATLDPSPRTDMLVNTQHVFEGTITPTPLGDLVPYTRGAYLTLRLELRTARPDNFYLGPKLMADLLPGGSMVLPLNEYEDPVDETFDGGGLVALNVTGSNHRLANPGETALYAVTLTNLAGPTQEFTFALVGSHREWSRVIGAGSVRLAQAESATVHVAVAVPADARDGDRADLVVEAASTESLEARALLRLVTTADTDADHPDDAAAVPAEKAKESPGPAASLIAALLAALGVLRRRRPA